LAKAAKNPLDYRKHEVILLLKVHFALGKKSLRVQFCLVLDGIEKRLELNVDLVDFNFLYRVLVLHFVALFKAIESFDKWFSYDPI
jgi:hypothetical protein